MDLEHMDWSEIAEKMRQELSLLAAIIATEALISESPGDCSRIWEIPVPGWKMRIYELIFRF